jgi:hypothetical protein
MAIKTTIEGVCKICEQQAVIYNDQSLNSFGKCKECAKKEWDERVKTMVTTHDVIQSTSSNTSVGVQAYWQKIAIEQEYVCHVP